MSYKTRACTDSSSRCLVSRTGAFSWNSLSWTFLELPQTCVSNIFSNLVIETVWYKNKNFLTSNVKLKHGVGCNTDVLEGWVKFTVQALSVSVKPKHVKWDFFSSVNLSWKSCKTCKVCLTCDQPLNTLAVRVQGALPPFESTSFCPVTLVNVFSAIFAWPQSHRARLARVKVSSE